MSRPIVIDSVTKRQIHGQQSEGGDLAFSGAGGSGSARAGPSDAPIPRETDGGVIDAEEKTGNGSDASRNQLEQKIYELSRQVEHIGSMVSEIHDKVFSDCACRPPGDTGGAGDGVSINGEHHMDWPKLLSSSSKMAPSDSSPYLFVEGRIPGRKSKYFKESHKKDELIRYVLQFGPAATARKFQVPQNVAQYYYRKFRDLRSTSGSYSLTPSAKPFRPPTSCATPSAASQTGAPLSGFHLPPEVEEMVVDYVCEMQRTHETPIILNTSTMAKYAQQLLVERHLLPEGKEVPFDWATRVLQQHHAKLTARADALDPAQGGQVDLSKTPPKQQKQHHPCGVQDTQYPPAAFQQTPRLSFTPEDYVVSAQHSQQYNYNFQFNDASSSVGVDPQTQNFFNEFSDSSFGQAIAHQHQQQIQQQHATSSAMPFSTASSNDIK